MPASSIKTTTLGFAALLLTLAAPAFAQTTERPPATRGQPEHSAELAACKATALIALRERDASIKDIEIDDEGLTVAAADTKVEDTPVKRIIMGDAALLSTGRDKPKRFLCLVGEKGKVLLTFFTQN